MKRKSLTADFFSKYLRGDSFYTSRRSNFGTGRLASDGDYCLKVQRELEDFLGVRRALLTTSCSDALEKSVHGWRGELGIAR